MTYEYVDRNGKKVRLNTLTNEPYLKKWPTRSVADDSSDDQFKPDVLTTESSTRRDQNEEVKSAPEKISILQERPSFAWSIGAGLFFNEIQSRDLSNNTAATFTANMVYGADSEFRYNYKEHWSFYFQGGAKRITFSKPSNRTLSKGSHTLLSSMLGVGVDKEYSLSLETGFRQRVFIEGVTSTNLELQKVAVPEVGLKGGIPLLAWRRWKLDANAGGSYYFSKQADGFKVKSGYGYEAELKATTHFSTHDLHVAPFYKRIEQDTNITSNTETEFGLKFGLQFSF